MKAKKLDPRGRTGKRSSGTIRRFLAMAGLLPPRSTRVADRHDPRQRPGRVQVWDAKAGAFRRVDPGDPHDPLRETARQLADAQDSTTRVARPEAPAAETAEYTAEGGCATVSSRTRTAGSSSTSATPPRSPFGGCNEIAVGSSE